MKCHQRKIRDNLMAAKPRPVHTSMDGYEVEPIDYKDAAYIILQFEWLKSMPTAGLAFYGLWDADDDLIGAVCFGRGSGSNAANLCGEQYRASAICLERGACAYWAHPHAASFLISRACKQAHKDHGWKIFYGYSDHEAGEIGTIYQACNWYYLGVGAGRPAKSYRFVYITPDGAEHSSRWWRGYAKREGIEWSDAEQSGWTRRKQYDKARYVWFEGGKIEKRRLRKALRYPVQDYPKRKTEIET